MHVSEYSISSNDNQLSLPLHDQAIETLYSFFQLHRRSRHETSQILKEYCRVLKPGGQLVIQIPDLDLIAKRYMEGKISFAELDRMIYGTQEDHADFIETGFNLLRLKSLLELVGFDIIQANVLNDWNLEVRSTKR